MRMGSTMRKTEKPAAAPPADRLRVVIADDASAMRALLRRMLEDTAAFEIVGEASDGEEAVRLAGTLHPDLVVLDLSMPVMGGLAAIPGIRRISPSSRIVVLSALEPGRVRDEAMASGADAFIEKCLVADSLAQRLVEACWFPPDDRRLGHARTRRAPPAGAADRRRPPGPDPELAEPDWFRVAFDHAPIGMALLDLQGRLEKVNGAFCRIVARVPADLVGTDVDVISHPGDVDRHAGLRRRLLADNRPVQDEHRFIRADGHLAWVVLTISLLHDGDGSPARFLCQALDVTDRKQAEVTSARAEELKERYEKELARSNAELAQFATVAAHDLKSPLQVIAGFAGLLEQTQSDMLDERGQEFLGFIVRSADRMNILIDDLLAYAKVGAERRLHVAVPLEPGGRRRGHLAGSRDREPPVGRSSTTPSRCSPGDPALFAHVIHNLVANGLKFVTPGVHAPRPGVGVEDDQRLVRRRRRQRHRHRRPAPQPHLRDVPAPAPATTTRAPASASPSASGSSSSGAAPSGSRRTPAAAAVSGSPSPTSSAPTTSPIPSP